MRKNGNKDGGVTRTKKDDPMPEMKTKRLLRLE
jgi:hypothetical protein